MTVVSTASGLLAMLQESHPTLKLHALKNLNVLVDNFWPEISTNISAIESLYEDDTFYERQLAALVASKVFYYLGELNDSLTYALGAGPLFDVSEDTEYVQTLVTKCVDEYILLSVKAAESNESEKTALDPRLVAIVERMLDKCMQDGKFQQAVGVALECRRLDKLEESIIRSENASAMLSYCLRLSQTFVSRREFRHEVLRLLVKSYQGLQQPDYLSICQCLMFLDEPADVAAILDKLLKGDKSEALLAYQIAFDLFENEYQKFLLNVRDLLPESTSASSSAPLSVTNGGLIQGTRGNGISAMTDGGPTAMDSDLTEPLLGSYAAEESADVSAPPVEERTSYTERLTKLKGILSGETPISLTLQFLYSHNRSDLLILKTIKQSVEMRNSVCHSATIYSNALMHAGTTVDTFLRENLDWLKRATNWAKFSATAGLGVIHRGHHQQGRSLMAPYLPQNGGTGGGSPYSEGGALYALGLIHANHGEGIKQFLLESLRNTSNEVIQHGACLGLGLAALGTADEEIYEDVKNVLYTDSAVAGEAAGIAMGLLMVGTASEKATEMLAYAHDTQHEKIIRGLALGIALVVYGREEEADTLIEQMTRDQDPILRYGGMYALAMAYRGTANNSAIRRLLHFAVSDVSDDVRRTAVLALGFVLCSEPEQTPRIVSLLSESYNAHVRYGAAMAVGISCAGSGSSEAISLLEPLTSDAVDFVRQGALIAMAMVLLQTTEAREPRVATFRRQLEKIINDKHEETMSKMGAILAQGILDAGGRNVAIMLQSRTGHDRGDCSRRLRGEARQGRHFVCSLLQSPILFSAFHALCVAPAIHSWLGCGWVCSSVDVFCPIPLSTDSHSLSAHYLHIMEPPAPPALYQGVLKDSKAFRLMTRMGWEEGSGLGKERQGITSHIRVKVRKDNSGVGTDDAKKAAANWTLHTVRVMNYDNILKNLKVQMTEPEVKEDSRDEASSDEDSSDDDSVDDVPSVQEEREIAAAAPAQAPTVIVEMERTVVESKEELMFVEMECEESVSLQEPAADWWGTKYGFVRGGALGSKVRQTVNGERQCQNGRTVFSEQDQENLYNLVNEKATSGKKGLGQDQRALKIGGVKISTRPGQKKVFANAEASDEDEVQGSVISDSQESEPVIEKKLAKRRKRDETSGFKAVLQEGSKIKLKELVAQFLAEAAEQKTSLKKLQRRVTASTGLFSSKDDAVRFRDKMLKSSKFVVEGNTISLKSRPQRYLLTR